MPNGMDSGEVRDRTKRMRVLFIASELYPLEKTGGLADVAAGLPSALSVLGVDVVAMVPGYPKAMDTAIRKQVIASTDDFLGFGPTRLIAAHSPDTNLAVYLIDCPRLYARRGGPYQNEEGQNWPDNAERFGLLCHAGALVGRGFGSGVPFDVVHLNDWHTGLVPVIFAASPGPTPATVFTIHNMAFQGNFAPEVISKLGLPDRFLSPDGVEFHGQLSFLKAGIRYSSRLTTVSPTYASEILTPEHGCGFDDLLRARAGDLVGILNGVDYRIWDPRHDMDLPARFNDADLSGKKLCKLDLQRQLGLSLAPDRPLVTFINRVTDQKMADVVLEVLPALRARNMQFALLGRGDRGLEEGFRKLALAHSSDIAISIGYEEPLARCMHAGADLTLVPSRFEPCGLTPLYAMRYGTLPIVRRVGGLTDTVIDAPNEAAGVNVSTGFAFRDPTADHLMHCIDRALLMFTKRARWQSMQVRAMQQDFSWTRQAERYLTLYESLVPVSARGRSADPNAYSELAVA